MGISSLFPVICHDIRNVTFKDIAEVINRVHTHRLVVPQPIEQGFRYPVLIY